MTEEDPAQSSGRELVGTILADRYRILKLLGAGAMGSVYVGEHLRIGRKDAIKVMHKAIANDDEAIARFTRGAQNASKVRHPNVCSIYDFGESEDGTVFLAMEFIDGESLQDYLASQQILPVAECVEIVEQVAGALQAAHDAGIVHRDLKPGNIMLTRDRSGSHLVKVVDFDIAKGSSESEPAELTQLGLVIGTPEYMSPEQLTADRLDGRSDVYSLGIVLFRMLTGVPPFTASSTREMLVQRLTAEPSTLADAVPDRTFPASIQLVLSRALERNPEDRYANAEAFAAALVSAASAPSLQPSASAASATLVHPSAAIDDPGEPKVDDLDIPKTETGWQPYRRRKRAFAYLIPAAVVLAASVTAGIIWVERSEEPANLDGPVEVGSRGSTTEAGGPVESADGDPVVPPTGSVEIPPSGGDVALADPGTTGPPTGTQAPGPETPVSTSPAGTPFTLASNLITFQIVEGGPSPEAHAVEIAGSVVGVLAPRVAYSLGEPSGWVTVELSAGRPPAVLSVNVDSDPLPVGTHIARVNLSDGSAYLGAVRVVLEKLAAGTSIPEPPSDTSRAREPETAVVQQQAMLPEAIAVLLDRQVNSLLNPASSAALEAVRDTARMVWSGEADSKARAQAAFVMAQAELIAQDAEAAVAWAERAVELAPNNEGYQRLLEDLRNSS